MANNNTKPSSGSEIPSGWKTKKIGDIAKVKHGRDQKKIQVEVGSYPILASGGEIGRTNTPIYSKPSVLIGRKGTIDKPRYADTPFWTVDTLFYTEISEKVLPKWLFYKFETINWYLYNEASGVPSLSSSTISSIKILLPRIPEQKAIAQLLTTWDNAITKTQSLIAQKEQRKKWLMQNLLTGKKRLKGFAGKWKKQTYEKLLKVVKRPVNWDEEKLYNLISVRRRSGGIFLREALYGHQIKVKDLRTVEEGDFLFSKMQILHGASAMVTKEFAHAKISGSYVAVVPKEVKLLKMEFLNWYSQVPYFYHQTFISSYGVTIEKMTFEFEYFLQLNILLPTVEEQIAIAQVLQAADKEIQLLKGKADKLKEQKKGLMQVLLTGKKRLKIKEK